MNLVTSCPVNSPFPGQTEILSEILENNSVHIWSISLKEGMCKFHDLSKYLSKEEILRSEKFRFQEDRERFVFRRGILRSILSKYLGIGPSDIEFGFSKFGKPSVPEAINEKNIRFNTTHTLDRTLIAITIEREVGIDIECVSRDCEHDEIAREFFSIKERDEFLKLPDEFKIQGFFNCWTRKEAFVKALGEGLSFPLKDFDVNITPNDPARIREIRNSDQKASDWDLLDIDVGRTHKAALAVEKPNSGVWIISDQPCYIDLEIMP